MTSSNGALARLFAWFLLVALIGVYLLYDWYSGHLKTQITELKAGVEQTTAGLKDREGLIASLQRDIADLTDKAKALVTQHARDLRELEDAKDQTQQQLAEAHASERAELEHRLTAAGQTISELEQALETLRETDAEVIATEQTKTAAALAERDRSAAAYDALQLQYDEAVAKSAQLEQDLLNLRQVIVDSTVEHREQIEALERHLNERIQLAKATPKDDDLMRAAQAAGLLPEAMHWAESVTAMAEQLAMSQEQIETLETAAEVARAQHEERIASLQADLEQAREQRRDPSQDPELTQQVAALQERLAQADAELDQVRSAASAELAAAKAVAAEALAAAESRVVSLTEALDQSPNAEQLAALQERLAQAEAELEQTRSTASVELETVKAAAAEVAEALAAAESRAEELAEQLAQAPEADSVTSLQEQLRATETALADVRSELDRRVEEGQANIAALSEQLASLKDDQEQISDEKTRLVAEYDVALEDANRALQAAQDELAMLRDELEQARRGAADAGSEALAELQATIASLETKMAEEQSKSAGLMADLRREAEQATASVRALYQRFAELGGTYTERGMLLNLADTELRFQPSMATLPETELPSLDRIAELLEEHPRLQVRIEGYTDSLGDEETNLALSQARAEAVQQALIERGVEPARMTAEGHGPERPIADNATVAGRAQNRRVEVYVIEG